MIANPKWFSPRKYTGWGLTPNCWQGWVYTLSFVLLVSLISYLPINQVLKNIIIGLIVGIFIIDVFHIMFLQQKDERERLHEALADRNALLFMLAALIVYFFVKQIFDPWLLVTLLGATLVKALTHFYLRDK